MFHFDSNYKIKSLNRSVFGPFKGFYNIAVNDWVLTPSNSGKPIIIYNAASLAGLAYPTAFCQTNIVNGFQLARFVPLHENIFPIVTGSKF